MATNFPGSLDNGTSLPYPNATNGRNAPSLAAGQDNQNDALIAVETKLGITASTPTLNQLLIGTGAGTSTWSKAAPTGVIVGTTDTQTLTNKTFTSPTINSPVISNATITTDVVSGFTSANSGTIYGIAVASGAITGANTVNGSALVSASVPASAIVAGSLTSTQIATNGIGAASLSTTAITLGYTPVTSGFFTTTSTTYVQVTGMTVTVTIPAGSRKIRVSAWGPAFYNATATNNTTASLWDGPVNTGTQISYSYGVANGGATASLYIVAIVTPGAGSKTYNLGLRSPSGTTATIENSSVGPMFMLVEAI